MCQATSKSTSLQTFTLAIDFGTFFVGTGRLSGLRQGPWSAQCSARASLGTADDPAEIAKLLSLHLRFVSLLVPQAGEVLSRRRTLLSLRPRRDVGLTEDPHPV
ncbi:hypothetical protein FRC19_001476 [Serendipita sp. 401]|nr:hypothetical protein FRC19_001476 [Serendipita sp. 401]